MFVLSHACKFEGSETAGLAEKTMLLRRCLRDSLRQQGGNVFFSGNDVSPV